MNICYEHICSEESPSSSSLSLVYTLMLMNLLWTGAQLDIGSGYVSLFLSLSPNWADYDDDDDGEDYCCCYFIVSSNNWADQLKKREIKRHEHEVRPDRPELAEPATHGTWHDGRFIFKTVIVNGNRVWSGWQIIRAAWRENTGKPG